jgi:hypothetical protein
LSSSRISPTLAFVDRLDFVNPTCRSLSAMSDQSNHSKHGSLLGI